MTIFFNTLCTIHRRNEGEPSPFDEPLLKEIATAKGKSIAQVNVKEPLSTKHKKIASSID